MLFLIIYYFVGGCAIIASSVCESFNPSNTIFVLVLEFLLIIIFTLMTELNINKGEDIDVMQEILDKSVELLFKIREAGKLQADISIADVMNDLDKHNQEIQQLIAKINPELHKILTDPKNKNKSSFELIKNHHCVEALHAAYLGKHY